MKLKNFSDEKGRNDCMPNTNDNEAMTIIYNSCNPYKTKEIEIFCRKNETWLTEKKIKFDFQKIDVVELQKGSLEDIARNKAKLAYQKIKRPVLVEHTVLQITALNDLPNHLTGEMWNTLGGYKICEMVKNSWSNRAQAISILAYCDGKKIRTFMGACKGQIAPEPRGSSKFQWDTIFIPEGQCSECRTFAEMEDKNLYEATELCKTNYSMRTKALEKFFDFLEKDKSSNDVKDKFLDYQKQYNRSIENLKTIIKSNLNGKKELVLFIGAGVSKNIDMPDWRGLIACIGEVLGYEEDLFLEKGSLIELADLGDRTDIHYLIKKVFSIHEVNKADKDGSEIKKINKIIEERYMDSFRTKLVGSAVYSFIAKLKCKDIYTTNYDSCIEEALRFAYSTDYSDVEVCTYIHGTEELTDETAAMIDEKKEYFNVYKLHGDLRVDKGIILDTKSYDQRYTEIVEKLESIKNPGEDLAEAVIRDGEFIKTDLNKRLYSDLQDKTVLFLGYGFGDCDINKLIMEARKNAPDEHKHYAFMAVPNEVKEQWLETNGITPIIPPTGKIKEELENFLRRLCEGDKSNGK